ncbi:hypothetical protein [Mycobacterium camsae]|uniref:hypothetical protein n=1 Tax=Mycobacterium gordonae TaxID=1778 RepID=UPI0019801B7D|nr:hypothetical protein [Mycobacterium gordonae]
MTGATEHSWSVEVGEPSAPDNPGVPPVPTTVYAGDEAEAKAGYADSTTQATVMDYRYVLLRHVGEVVDCWGTPPAVG